MTITEMIAKVVTRLGHQTFWTDAEITDYLNDGYRDFVSLTHCLKKFVLIDLTTDIQSYDLPIDCLQPLWFGYDDEGIIPASVSDLDRLDEEWVSQVSGIPTHVAVGLSGIDKFYLYKSPAISSVALGNSTTALIHFEDWTDNILLFYEYEIETDLTAGQSPDLETCYQWALIYYALWQCLEKAGDSEDLEQAAFWKLRYEQKVAEKKNQLTDQITLISGSGISQAGEEGISRIPWMIEWKWEDIEEIILDADGTIYFGRYNTTLGDWPSGTFKITRIDNDIAFYRYESSLWVEKGRIFA